MPFLEAVKLALDTIRVQKLKSFFTLLGVTIGVMFLIAVVSIVEGMTRYVEDDFAGRVLGANPFPPRGFRFFGNHVTAAEWREWQRRPRVYHSDVEFIKGVLPNGPRYAVESEEFLYASSTYVGKQKQVDTHAVEGDYFTVKKYDLSTGRTISEQEYDLGSPVVVIGDDVAKFFFPNLNPLDRQLRIGSIPSTVIAVLAHQASLSAPSLYQSPTRPLQSP